MKIIRVGGWTEVIGEPKTKAEKNILKYEQTLKKQHFLNAAKGLWGEDSEMYQKIKRMTLKELMK